jgi:hypothetical protein
VGLGPRQRARPGADAGVGDGELLHHLAGAIGRRGSFAIEEELY